MFRQKSKFILSEMPIKFVLIWISLFPRVRFQPKAIALNNVKQLVVQHIQCNNFKTWAL